jgi:hypothetical protein
MASSLSAVKTSAPGATTFTSGGGGGKEQRTNIIRKKKEKKNENNAKNNKFGIPARTDSNWPGGAFSR